MITYLIGAGASYNAVPLVEEMPKSLDYAYNNLLSWIPLSTSESFPHLPGSKRDVGIELMKSLKWLQENSTKHFSIDTFAKKLFLRGDLEKYHELKSTLAAFIMLEEKRNPPNQRYDSFWAAVLDRTDGQLRMPESIRIFTWNYDSQFERAFFPFCQHAGELERHLQSYASTPESPGTIDPQRFCIIRINGNATLTRIPGRGIARRLLLAIEENTPAILEDIVELWGMYKAGQDGFAPVLNFAWEENEFTSIMRPNIEAIASATNVLVVIGYSFPFFNQKMDRHILDRMGALRSVYLQAPEEKHSELVDRFMSLRPDLSRAVKPIRDLAQFFVPSEFSKR